MRLISFKQYDIILVIFVEISNLLKHFISSYQRLLHIKTNTTDKLTKKGFEVDMEILSSLYYKIPKRMEVTFLLSFVIGLLIHLFVIVNEFLNHDNLFNLYSYNSSSGSGRFTLKFFKGITSYFDVHYINGVLSIVFLAITIALLVELFQLTSKWAIIPFAIIYLSYPTVSGTFAYMFTSHAYFLAALLTVISIYLCFKLKKKWVAIIIGALLMYLALGTYQINIAYGSTLVVLLLINQLILNKKIEISSYVSSFTTHLIGLVAYVLHFKIYQKVNGLLDYNGISNSGKINLETIKEANSNVFEDIKFYFFNGFDFERLFEILNASYLVLFFILLITICIIKKTPISKIVLSIIAICTIPYTLYLIFFISPDVVYHLIMKQHFALIYIVGISFFQVLIPYKNYFSQGLSIFVLIFLLLTGYNQVLISNIYYEKLSDLNRATYSLMTRITYDIQHVPGYNTDYKFYIHGNPSINNISVPRRYDLFTPSNVGVGSRIVYDHASAAMYIQNEIGLPNLPVEAFAERHKEELSKMAVYPAEGSVKIIDDTIVVNFNEVK